MTNIWVRVKQIFGCVHLLVKAFNRKKVNRYRWAQRNIHRTNTMRPTWATSPLFQRFKSASWLVAVQFSNLLCNQAAAPWLLVSILTCPTNWQRQCCALNLCWTISTCLPCLTSVSCSVGCLRMYKTNIWWSVCELNNMGYLQNLKLIRYRFQAGIRSDKAELGQTN